MVPIVDVECLKKCPAIAMVRFKSIPKADRGIGKRVSQVVAPVRRLLNTDRKITRPVRPKSRLGIGQ